MILVFLAPVKARDYEISLFACFSYILFHLFEVGRVVAVVRVHAYPGHTAFVCLGIDAVLDAVVVEEGELRAVGLEDCRAV